MFIVYLACLIFGGILILFSLFTGGHSNEVDSHSVLSQDIDHSLAETNNDSLTIDTETQLDAHNELHTNAIESGHNSTLSEIGKIFNFRNILYFVAFFGLSGTIGSLFDFNDILTFLGSIFTGVLAGGFGYSLMKYLNKNESGEGIEIYELSGHFGVASLPISKNRKGKIIIESYGATIELIAILNPLCELEEIPKGEKVVIIEFDDKVAVIDKFDV